MGNSAQDDAEAALNQMFTHQAIATDAREIALSDVLIARFELVERADASSYQPTTAYLLEHKLDWKTIVAFAGLLTVQDGVLDRPGSWDLPDDHGRPTRSLAILEAIGPDGEEVLDLVAWPVDDPSNFRRMFGYAVMLGEWNVYDPTSYAFGKALDVYETPLDWLKAGCNGIVCLDLPACARVMIDAPGRWACRDKGHAYQLAQAMRSLVDIKRIVIPVEAAE